jgi:ubiquinone/menaquinone biosynthesis C-methylase UbiE
MSSLNPEIEEFYRHSDERHRLSGGAGMLEKLRMLSIFARHLPPPPAAVIDVGGATGAHAFPLAVTGYEVHLIDAVRSHIDQATEYERECGTPLASINLSDARHLQFASNKADAILLLGPRYHLTDVADRIKARREALRVLKPRGVLIAAAISRFASLMEALSIGTFRDTAFQEIIASDLLMGQHRSPTGQTPYFTTPYFHLPKELGVEVVQAGFGDVPLLALEGPGWASTDTPDIIADPNQRDKLLTFLSLIETERLILARCERSHHRYWAQASLSQDD